MVSVQDREQRARLRGAVFRGDGAAVVRELRDAPWPDDALQLIGDGLLAALADHVGASDDLARTCGAALRERGWEGDEELAESLDARLGNGPSPLLRPLAVDLDELADVLEGDPVNGGGRVDLRSGEVWPRPALEYAEDIDEELDDDPDRWLWVDPAGSRDAYHDMELFIAGLSDPQLADRLGIGRGRARAWLAVEGYAPAPRRPPDA